MDDSVKEPVNVHRSCEEEWALSYPEDSRVYGQLMAVTAVVSYTLKGDRHKSRWAVGIPAVRHLRRDQNREALTQKVKASGRRGRRKGPWKGNL